MDNHPGFSDDFFEAEAEPEESATRATARGAGGYATEREKARCERNAQSVLDGLRRQREAKRRRYEDYCAQMGRR